MIFKNLKDKNIILGSSSKRRQELLNNLGLKFRVELKKFDEKFPQNLNLLEVSEYLALEKASQFILKKNELLITSDTTVILNNSILNKPKNYTDAFNMLKNISGKKHIVNTGVCIKSKDKIFSFNEKTYVWFNVISKNEIEYYINKYKPYDKAGSYGIQEWIGFIGIKEIKGCYYNVMGLPISKLYKKLKEF